MIFGAFPLKNLSFDHSSAGCFLTVMALMGLDRWSNGRWSRLTPAVYLFITRCSDSFVQFQDAQLSLRAMPQLFGSQRNCLRKKEKSWWGRDEKQDHTGVTVWCSETLFQTVPAAPLSFFPKPQLYLVWVYVCIWWCICAFCCGSYCLRMVKAKQAKSSPRCIKM